MQMGGRSVRNGPGELVGSTLPDIGTMVRRHLGGDFLSSGGHFPGSDPYLLKIPRVREAAVTPKGSFLSPVSLRSLKCIKLRSHTLYPVTDRCLRPPVTVACLISQGQLHRLRSPSPSRATQK